MGCLDPWTSCEQVIYLQGICDLIFYATFNASKSRIMQKMLGENTHKVQYIK